MCLIRKLLLCVCLYTLASAPPAQAADGKAPWEDFGSRIKASEQVAAHGPNLFGDAVSLSNGALSFTVTDLSIPGNGPEVSFSRTYQVKDWKRRITDHMLADWEVQIPHISSINAPDWVASDGTTARCSVGGRPQAYTSSGLQANDYWQGLSINIPGVTSGELLRRAPETTAPDPSYTWMTNDQVHAKCLGSIGNGDGEGFQVIAADGTRYWFDWMGQSQEPPLRRGFTSIILTWTPYTPREYFIPLKRNVLYVTKIQDRFGKVVNYEYSNNWNEPGRLTRISASDGREINIIYDSDNRIHTVSDGSRSWIYQYVSLGSDRDSLAVVTQPDQSQWTIDFSEFTTAEIDYTEVFQPGEIYRTCTRAERPLNEIEVPEASVVHPSGAVGIFKTSLVRHNRSNVPLTCNNVEQGQGIVNDTNDDMPFWPLESWSYSLKSKRIEGPGQDPAQWNYSYTSDRSFVYRNKPGESPFIVCTLDNWADCEAPACLDDSCAGVSETVVDGPGSDWVRYTYGNSHLYNEGKLLEVEVGGADAAALRTVVNTYDLQQVNPGAAYSPTWGSGQRGEDSFQDEYLRPLVTTVIQQQGVNFTRSTSQFDSFARPVAQTVSGTSSRSEVFEYHDNVNLWVLGQRERVLIDGFEVERTEFNSSALAQSTFANGLPVGTMSYDGAGNLASFTDALQRTTGLEDWYRGVPRTIRFPDNRTQVVQVTNQGWITQFKDELGHTTQYGRDAMGRLSSIVYPSSGGPWHTTVVSFAQSTAADKGIAAGHWVRTETTGNTVKRTFYDGRWRPILTYEADESDVVTKAATTRYQVKEFDHEGRETFSGYPTDDMTTYGALLLADGVTTSYDALGRTAQVSQDSEKGTLSISTSYLSGFITQVTDPQGNVTDLSYQAFDQPDMSRPTLILSPEETATSITRDLLGYTRKVSRIDTSSPEMRAVDRHYVYDANKRLCRVVEPETGDSVYFRDAVGNISWSATGQPQSPPHSLSCSFSGVPNAEKVHYTYDLRNRLYTTTYPDDNGSETRTYHGDGLLKYVKVWNEGGASSVTTTYAYNGRRLLTEESQSMTGGLATWTIGYDYTPYGHLNTLTYPAGLEVTYSPNGLGQPTRVESATRTFASDVKYWPSGALRAFTYGNGIQRTIDLNDRLLPERIRDFRGSTEYLDDSIEYDRNGNVTEIDDGRAIRPIPTTRNMNYDGLNRLTHVTSSLYGSNGASYTYDAYDNLTAVVAPGRNHAYCYDVSTNRLDEVRNGSCGGSVAHYFDYDSRGNVTSKSGVGGSLYTFDFGNRLRTAGTESYRYDGLGRRVLQSNPAGLIFSMYSQSGQPLWVRDERLGKRRQTIYLDGKLIAERLRPIGADTETVKYQHTDLLGTPVAVTNTNATPTTENTFEYEPYGKLMFDTHDDTVGYTGHVMDKATGLLYMQQRYYDPMIGRFLSVDPMASDTTTGWNFNRYNYAANNPYKFIDPDGRAVEGSETACSGEGNTRFEYLVDYLTIGIFVARRHIENLTEGEEPTEPVEESAEAVETIDVRSMSHEQIVQLAKEHTSGARPSTKGKHERGKARKKRDRGGEEGDSQRRPPRKRPPNHRGPWPPKDEKPSGNPSESAETNQLERSLWLRRSR